MPRAEVHKLMERMAIPAIAAPMFLVSNPALTLACCGEGLMGSFPAHGTRSREEFQGWLDEMVEGMKRLEDAGKKPAPWAVNLVVHASNPRYQGDLELVEKYKVPVILTSKGAPGDAIKRIHGWGAVALHDIANRRHAEKALEAGVDGVIAVAGGAGGHTGTINPFALMNEVRQLGDSFAVVLAGGQTTGRDVLAAEAMGADLAYIGTRFIATQEAMAAQAHKDRQAPGHRDRRARRAEIRRGAGRDQGHRDLPHRRVHALGRRSRGPVPGHLRP
jgi:nitronate monooxygenase